MKLWFQTQNIFFFFCQSTHFQVLHYTQNKYLKKTFTKLKTLTMLHAMGAKSWEGGMWRGSKRDEVGRWIRRGGRVREEERSQRAKGQRTAVSPWCHVSFVTQ